MPDDVRVEVVTAARFSPSLSRRLFSLLYWTFVPRMLQRPQAMRASQFAAVGTAPERVVMFGDSITELGLWQECFPGFPVLNRGIAGDTTTDLLRRVHTAINKPLGSFS